MSLGRPTNSGEEEAASIDQFNDYFSNLFLLFGARVRISEIVVFAMEATPERDPMKLTLHIIHSLNQSLMKAAMDTEDVTPAQHKKIETLLTSTPQLYKQFTPDSEYLELSSRFLQLQDMV